MELPKWSDAVCASIGGDFWFPETGENDAVKHAKRVCGTCPIQVQCLEYAVSAPRKEIGIWGGATLQERTRIRMSRGVAEQMV